MELEFFKNITSSHKEKFLKVIQQGIQIVVKNFSDGIGMDLPDMWWRT
jgi:hypothetical protein